VPVVPSIYIKMLTHITLQTMGLGFSGDPARGSRKIHEQEIVQTLDSMLVQRAQVLLGQEVGDFG
jgi:hypothetical protein